MTKEVIPMTSTMVLVMGVTSFVSRVSEKTAQHFAQSHLKFPYHYIALLTVVNGRVVLSVQADQKVVPNIRIFTLRADSETKMFV